ncbi:MAG: PAS domain-containing protein [Phycisphaerales bacterium]|nr:MAG: PAS domain-containing protein [Phycisphaerales bacterium]
MSDSTTNKVQRFHELDSLRARLDDLTGESQRHDEEKGPLIFLAELVEKSEQGLAIVGLEGKVIFVNQAFATMHGFDANELRDEDVRILYPAGQLAEVDEAERSLQDAGEYRGEIWRLHRDGTRFPTFTTNSLLRDVSGNPMAVVCVVTDLTDLKQTEAELLRLRGRYEAAIEATGHILYDTDLRTKELIWGGNAKKSLGYELEELGDLDKWVSCLVHPEDRERFRNEVDRCLAERNNFHLRYRVRHKNGDYITVDDNGRIFFDEKGSPIRAVGCLVHITSRQKTEEKLRDSEQRFRLAAQATRDGIYDWDIVADRSWRNDRYRELFAPPESSSYDWWAANIHPSDRDGVVQRLERAFAILEDFWDAEYRFLARGGEYAHVLDRGFILRDERGRPLRMIGAMTDITTRQVAEEQAREQLAQLAHRDRLSFMGEMAAGLAHELSQPLAAIIGYVQGCIRRLAATSDDATGLLEPLNQVAEEADRAARIIDGLKRFMHKRVGARSAAAINELVRNVQNLVMAEARRRQVEVHVELDEQLPLVQVDSIQIQQVILNLIRNAFEAIEQGKPANRRVAVRTSRCAESTVEVSVADSGPGFSPKVEEQLFAPFFTTKAAGTGMGLLISKRIVEAHGGQLVASSTPGQGAVFKFTLPAQTRSSF